MESRDSFDPSSLSGISAAFDPLSTFDDSVAFTDNLALDDDPLFPADWDQETPPYEGNLYSTPLSWEQPIETKVEPLPTTSYTTMNTLTPAQQEKLRNIAMPQHLQYRSQHSPNSTASNKSRSISSPDNHDREERSRKRKSSAEADDDEDDDSNPPVKKTAHNMIEKRYRTNLNDKIAALRDSVPSLRIMTKSARGEDTADDREDLQGLTPAHKLNKATVLSKATEYINHLEKRNKRLQDENAEQKARLAAFETLFRSGSMGFNPAPSMGNPFQFNEYNTPGPSPGGVEPQGMIHVPDDIRRLQNGMNQQHFPVPQEQYHQPARPMGQNGWQNNPYFGKLMVGSLAGLMFFEGMRETEQKEDSPNARGLFALPIHLLRGLSSGLHSHLEFNIFGTPVHGMTWLKVALVFGILLYAFLPSLFASKPKPDNGKTQPPSLAAAPSLASPIQVRRRAWLTAIQTVWVPRHNLFLEGAALWLKSLKLSTRNVIGAHYFAWITGVTEQQEIARVKAWTIALDAQLAGGDVEVSWSRLTLTLLASYTLPVTPARLMLMALHLRVLLWELGNVGFNGFYLFPVISAKLARSKWTEARSLHKLMTCANDKQEDVLPDYLVALLEQNCDSVLVDSISQRAYNLAWNLPTTNNIEGGNDGMDGVVNDHAIRSPLDAVAAWYSSLVLERALAKSLSSSEDDLDAQVFILDNVNLAIETAPIGSAAQVRALVARAVLVKEKRGASIATAMAALGPLEKKQFKKSTSLIKTTTSLASLPDVKMSLCCAMAMAHIERFPSPSNPETAHRIIATIHPRELSLLGFTACFNLMEKIDGHDLVAVSCTSALEHLAGALRIWIGGQAGEKSSLDKQVKRAMVERCLNIKKRIVGMEDAGYESMSDDGEEGC
ncbi:hypothetical protein BDZ45DRAFT_666999 [Acephala macrosclerotiorum]|nr:hypothetical protein BDZ45DRAFT_666999 [Acephala macrosclerotiorum]